MLVSHILATFKVLRQQACDRDLHPSRPGLVKMGLETPSLLESRYSNHACCTWNALNPV